MLPEHGVHAGPQVAVQLMLVMYAMSHKLCIQLLGLDARAYSAFVCACILVHILYACIPVKGHVADC